LRAVVQRVLSASVHVDGELISEIDSGILLFLGLGKDDSSTDLNYIADKIVHLRIFEDSAGKMNHSILEQKGSILCVSQFTLYGDTRKGRRPSYNSAADPEHGKLLYEQMLEKLSQYSLVVKAGIFGADMQVELVNDGPVTLLIDSQKEF
jgi:D-tyrosyl-tRNA(Tyr) deacylase